LKERSITARTFIVAILQVPENSTTNRDLRRYWRQRLNSAPAGTSRISRFTMWSIKQTPGGPE
jgi:hypothetical protein